MPREFFRSFPNLFLLLGIALVPAACIPVGSAASTPSSVAIQSPASTLAPTPIITHETDLPVPGTDQLAFILAGQLGGTANAVALDGSIVYAGIGMRLMTVDVSDPTAPRLLGQSETLLGVVEAVAVQGNIAYVGAGADLYIYDVSNPAAPVRVSTLFRLADSEKLSQTDIIPASDFLYVHYRPAFQGRSSLVAVNVSNPAQPIVVDRRDFAVTAAVSASGGVLYIVNEGKLQLVDAAVPGNTLGESDLEFRLSDTYWRYFITVVGNLAFVGVTQQPLQVWDVSDPAQPVRLAVSDVDLPQSDIIKTDGEALFLVDMSNADCNYIVRVIDVADPAALQYRAASEQFSCISDIAIDQAIVVASTEGGLQIFDRSDPVRLPTVGGFVPPAGFDMVYNVTLNGNLAYIILGHGDASRLAVMDRAEPTAPVTVGEPLGLPLIQGCGVNALYVRGDRLYVVPGCGPTIVILDISDPAKPRLIPNEGEVIDHWATVPALNGNVIYTPVAGGLGIFDMSDPAHPVRVSTLPWKEGIAHIAISDRYLIIRPYSGTAWVLYDLSDPLRPVEVGLIEDQFRVFAVVGNKLFFVPGWDTAPTDATTLIIQDISDPAHPGEIGRLDLSFHPHEMVSVGDTLYLLMGGGEWAESMSAVNVGDAAHPHLEWNLPLRVNDFGVDGNLLYLAAGEAGLVILQDRE